MHSDPGNENALFQVASQFNLLEMTGPDVTPEAGVTRYQSDYTQGPACAMAAGAATIYRNYFVEIGDQRGQTQQRQIDCLADVGAALGNERGTLWGMRNGYAMCNDRGISVIDSKLRAASEAELDEVRRLLRIGVHWDVEVTASPKPCPRVSQAFCSALPIGYWEDVHPAKAKAFATLVLDATYEATLLAAMLSAARSSSRTVFLTRVGGGVFQNDVAWIDAAMRRALNKFSDIAIDVRLVSFGDAPVEFVRLAQQYG
jgi:hypothetical protein